MQEQLNIPGVSPEQVEAIINIASHRVAEQVFLHMQEHPHTEGLMHLGALSVAITAAYLGMDRIGELRDKVVKEFEDIRSSVFDALRGNKNELVTKEGRVSGPPFMKRSFRLKALVWLANGKPFDKPLRRYERWFWGLIFAYFYPQAMMVAKRVHKWVLVGIGAINFATFLAFVCASSLSRSAAWIAESHSFILASAAAYVLAIALIFVFIVLLHDLRRKLQVRAQANLSACDKAAQENTEWYRDNTLNQINKDIEATDNTPDKSAKRCVGRVDISHAPSNCPLRGAKFRPPFCTAESGPCTF